MDVLGEDRAPARHPWLRRVLGSAVALALVAVVGPQLWHSSGLARPAAEPVPTPTTSAPTPSSSLIPELPPYSWPLRGDLAGDQAFVAEALGKIESHDPVGSLRPLWAGTAPDGGRLLLAVGLYGRLLPGTSEPAQVLALHAPAGVEVADGEVQATHDMLVGGGLTPLAGWLGAGDEGRPLVVIGPPDLQQVQTSDTVRFAADGSASRTWRPLDLHDGTIATVLPAGSARDRPLAVRPAGDDVVRALPLVLGESNYAGSSDDVEVRGLDDPGYRGPHPLSVRAQVAPAGRFGTVRNAEVVWSGAVGRRAEAVVVIVRLDGGGTLQWIGLESRDGDLLESSGSEFRSLPWADADRQPALLFVGRGADASSAVLLSPSGGGTVEVRPHGAGSPRTLTIGRNGAVALPDDVRDEDLLVVREAAGRRIASTTASELLGDDPYFLDP